MDIKDMNLEQVQERLAALDEEVRQATSIEDVEQRTEEKKELLERKAELENLEARKKSAIELKNGATGRTIENGGTKEDMEKKTYGIETLEYREAYLKHLQGKELTAEERAVVTATAAIPTITMNKVVSKLESAPLLKRISLIQLPGYVSIPYEDSVEDAAWTAMGTAATDSKADVKGLELSAYKLIKTVEIGADVSALAIDAFEDFLVTRLTAKMEKALQAAVISGTGTNQPTGLTKSGEVTTTKEFTKAGITYADLLTIMSGIAADYQGEATWSIPSTIFFKEIWGMVDSSKRPIVVADVVNGAEYRLLGRPVDLVDAAADTIVYGAFKNYYMNLGTGIEIKADQSAGFRNGSTVYRAMALADGGNANKDAFVVATRATA